MRVSQELGSPIPDRYKKITAIPDNGQLPDYEGIYVSKELSAWFSISAQNNQLVIATKYSEKQALTQISNELFSSPDFDLHFIREGSRVRGLTISTQRAWNIHFERVDASSP
jgi:hypothetical protein